MPEVHQEVLMLKKALQGEVFLILQEDLHTAHEVSAVDMVRLKKINPLPESTLQEIGFTWHTDSDGSAYISDEMVVISQKEALAYYEAANELYDMFVEAAEYVIKNDLFFELGIPFNLVDIIKKSWENDVHWHIYARFDFAGGIDNQPIKLLEFNADTPTALFESSVLQWAMLKHNSLDESSQFNDINVITRYANTFKQYIKVLDNMVEFIMDGVLTRSRLINGTYPDFERIIPNFKARHDTRVEYVATGYGVYNLLKLLDDGPVRLGPLPIRNVNLHFFHQKEIEWPVISLPGQSWEPWPRDRGEGATLSRGRPRRCRAATPAGIGTRGRSRS